MGTGQQEALLLAGALLPPGGDRAADLPLEPVRARRYRHPALPGWTVVRLAGETAAAGEDRVLAFLGFEAGEAGEPLARALRRGLGYVEWVLVHDPGRAGTALAAAAELERATRLAPSRPLAATRRFEALAGRVPPTHLPVLWEHAGRAFLAGGGRRRWAAAMFERAREAERVHGLPVDMAASHEACREFAFAGALRAGSVARHVAELRRRSPEAAWRALLELAPRCVGSGMPPWSALPVQLRRAAREAGRDPDAEEARLLGRLLVLPATRLAPAGFWRRCRPTLVGMGRASAAVRGELLDLLPTPRQGRGGFYGWWLDLLDDAGALDALTRPAGELPAEAGPAPGAAGWLGRFVRCTHRRWWEPDVPAQLFTLLSRMAARLAADGEPVVLRVERRGCATIDANVADACLEHGIPLADPGEADEIDLHQWATSASAVGTRRELMFAAADTRFAPLLQEAVFRFCRRPGRQLDDLLTVPALRQVVGRALGDRVAALGSDGLAHAADLLDELAEVTSRRTFGRFPSTYGALAGTDLAVPLARTLRAGLLDELGWPALEEAMGELAGGEQLDLSASWPVLVVHDRVRAIAVGPGGRAAEHDLRLTNPDHSFGRSVRYAGGEFLVRWYDRVREQEVAYWSGAPTERFPLVEYAGPYWRDGSAEGFAFLLPDGGRVAGGRALYPGDRGLPPEAHACWDGETFWVLDGRGERDERPGLRELDPLTGERGRRSLPAFFAELRPGPGEALAPALCSLAPLRAGLDGTPLGRHGGLVGFRVAVGRWDGRQRLTIEGVDGRRLAGPDPDPHDPMLLAYHLARGVGPVGLVTLPGAAGPLLLSGVGRYSLALALWDAELDGPVARVPVGAPHPDRSVYDVEPCLQPAGTPLVVPPAFWHCLTPRDEAGSRALRRVTEELAGELLAAALGDLDARPAGRLATVDQMERTAAAVERLLPAVSHPRLRRGVVGAVRSAAFAQRRLDALVQRHAPAPGASPAAMTVTAEGAAGRLGDDLLATALAGLGGPHPEHARDLAPGRRTADQLHLLGRFFAGDLGPEAIEPSLRPALRWEAMLGRAGAVAFRAASPATAEQDRATLLDLLELWARLPFSADPTSFWTGRLRRWPALAGRSGRSAFAVLAEHPGPFALSGPLPQHGGCVFVERRGEEPSALAADAEVAEQRRVEAGWGTPEQLAAFVRAARARGPVPWDPAVPEALAVRTGLTRPEAALLWAGLPDLDAVREGRDVLGPRRRRLLGVSAVEAAAASESLCRLPLDRRYELLHAAMPDDPARLWTPLGAGPDDESSPVARLAAAWVRTAGRRRRVPEDALGEAATLRESTAAVRSWPRRPAVSLLELLVDPAGEPALVEDRDWRLDDSAGRPVLHAGGVEDDMGALLVELAVLLPWAFATRPVGDPLRARLPEALTLVRSRLAHPGLLLKGPTVHGGHAGETLRREFGSRPYRGRGVATTADGDQAVDDGLTVAAALNQGWWTLYFRPALLGEHDARSRRFRRWLLPEPGGDARMLVGAIDLLRGQGYAAMAARVRSTPVPPGGHEADPSRSVARTVRAARAALGLDEDAAVLYLQLLALPEPTDRNLRRWNRWTPARHRRAAARLLAAGLVLEARRPRAGRRLFLPGDWVQATAPNLPLEAWKLPLYRIAQDPASGRPGGPLPRFLPLVPLHELFAAAWDRVERGDRPGPRSQGGVA